MTETFISAMRLQQQGISLYQFNKPADLVQHMIAIQAQEYAMAKWAIGLRLSSCTDGIVEKAFNDGHILRTHLLRPTWHFVSPADIRWLLKLTAPSIKTINGFIYRQQQLTPALFKRSNSIIEKALQRGQFLTRKAIQEALRKNKIIADGVRLAALMMQAELEGLICSGPRQGKQFTYALLEERVPPAKKLSRDEALAQFGLRYFQSRGPATAQDFANWSGLSLKDVRSAISTLPTNFIKEKIGSAEYIIDANLSFPKSITGICFLMPIYDEYGMSYKDRSALLSDPAKQQQFLTFNNLVILDGKAAGLWKREWKGKELLMETRPFFKLNARQARGLSNAVKAFRKFNFDPEN